VITTDTPTWQPFAIIVGALIAGGGILVWARHLRKQTDSRLEGLSLRSMRAGAICLIVSALASALGDLLQIMSNPASSPLTGVRGFVVTLGIGFWVALWCLTIVVLVGVKVMEFAEWRSRPEPIDKA
jgi:hypothetical protein